MEKQEARIKCTGCGSSYKLKVPVTDKPVNFKCKKCGKILKVKITAADGKQPAAQPAPPPPPQSDAPVPGLETTQLPEFDDFFDSGGAGGQAGEASQPGFQLDPTLALFSTDRPGSEGPKIKPTLDETVRIPEPVFEQGYADQLLPPPKEETKPSPPPRKRRAERRWLALDDEQVKGPFTDDEVVAQIEDEEITAETPLRMGQRPWIKAAQVADFKHCFHKGRPIRSGAKRADPGEYEDDTHEPEEPEIKETPFYEEFKDIAPYPLGSGNWQPVAIFAGAAFVLCTILSFNFFIGLPISIAGWILLYGYLSTLRDHTKNEPKAPPPAWDFSQIKEMALGGVPVFVLLLVYSLIPVTICLLIMIACFLNNMEMLGYLFMAVTVLVFVASMFVVPAALAIQDERGSLSAGLNPGKILKLMFKGSTPYKMLGATSIGGGTCLHDRSLAGSLSR